MKTYYTLLFTLFTTILSHAQQPSIIHKVTVYLDGAEIQREADISLKSGTTEFILNNLSPEIEESSIQVSGLKSASVLSVNYGINYLSKVKETDTIMTLKDDLKQLENNIKAQYHLIAGYNEELSLIQTNKRLGNDTEVVNLEQLKSFANYFRERITALKSNIYHAELNIETFETEKTALVKQLKGLNTDEKIKTGEIKVKLNALQPEKLKINLTYNIKNAGWFPTYDLKADKINSPINLQYKAHIYQNSGCDWDNVKLVLSTSDPNTNNEKPIVNPKYLNFINPNSNYQRSRATHSYNYKYNPSVKYVSGIITSSSDGLPLPGANIIEKGTSNGVQTDFDGKYTLSTSSGNTLVYSYVGMDTQELPIHSSIMNVALDEGAALDEVVVVGYSTGSSSSSYTNTSIQSADIVNNLYGSVPGISIRGASSLPGKNNLIYVVDGVVVKQQAVKHIDPNSIESINVLKDTNTKTIYGNRGANGVILIETAQNAQRTTNTLGIVVENGITNTRFEIDKKHTILSNADVSVIEIDRFAVPATYNYFAAPLLNENVFLTAKIGNWQRYNLLPAEANVYFEGSYSGKTNINPGATTDSLTISLGVDPNISIKRRQKNDFKKQTLIGNNRVVNKAFEVEIRNNKQSDIQLTLVDRIPISQNRAIKLEVLDTGNSLYNKDKGVLKWSLNLKPGETTKVEHAYTIKFPKGKRVNL